MRVLGSMRPTRSHPLPKSEKSENDAHPDVQARNLLNALT